MGHVIRIRRVIGAQSPRAGVLAFVDDHKVTWRPSGWHCDCTDDTCGHVDAVADLLDPRVTDKEPQPTQEDQ